MREAREKILFVLALLVAVGLGYMKLSDAYVKARVPASRSLESAELANPPLVRLAAAGASSPSSDRERSAFAPPRELLPMDPLQLPMPPFPPLSLRRPTVQPAMRGAAASAYRVPADSLGQLELTASDEGGEVAGGYGFGDVSSGAGKDGGGAGDFDDEDDVGSVELYDELYDWIVRNTGTNRHYGRILNEDTHGLRDRPREALRFQDVSLRSGTSIGVPYDIPREEISEWALARTFENGYLASSRALGTGVGSVKSRMQLAFDMAVKRLAEPRGLEFAEREARLAVQYGAADPAPARLLARILSFSYDQEGELAVYREAFDRGSVDAALLSDYARFARRLGLRERAAELVEQGRLMRQASAELRATQGLLLMDEGRLEEALKAFREADQVSFRPPFEDRQRDELIVQTGVAELALGRPEEALREAERVLLGTPDRPDALLLAGAAQAALGRLDEAAETFGTALANDPTNSALLTNAAIVAWRRGDGPGALRLAEQARDIDPYRAAEPTLALGFFQEDAADPERARDLYAEALRIQPGHPEALYRLGRNQRLDGDAESAGATLRLALRLKGPDALLLSELGRAALDRAQPAIAARYFREGLRIEPENGEILWLLGLSYLVDGDLVSALSVLEQAVAQGAPGAHAGLGVAHYMRGDEQAAMDQFDEVARAYAGNSDDPTAVFAAEQLAAVRDNLSKRQWVDQFGRSSLQRGWSEHQWDGSPRVFLDDDAVHVNGRMEKPREDERPGIGRSVDGRTVVSVSAELSAAPGAGDSRYGLALTYRQARGLEGRLPKARLEIWVDPAGQVRVSVLDNFSTQVLDGEALPGLIVPPGTSVRVGIERVDPVAGSFRFLVDGRPVGDVLDLKVLRNFKNLLDLEIYGEAAPGRDCHTLIHAVRIVQFP